MKCNFWVFTLFLLVLCLPIASNANELTKKILFSVPLRVSQFSQRQEAGLVRIKAKVLLGPGSVDVKKLDPASFRMHLFDKQGRQLTRRGLELESLLRERKRLLNSSAASVSATSTPVPCRTAFPTPAAKATPTAPPEVEAATLPIIGKIAISEGRLILVFRGTYAKRHLMRRPYSMSIGAVAFNESATQIAYRVTANTNIKKMAAKERLSVDGYLPITASAVGATGRTTWCYYTISGPRSNVDPDGGDRESRFERCGGLFALDTHGVESLVIGDDTAIASGYMHNQCPVLEESDSRSSTGFWKIQFDLVGSNCGEERYHWSRNSQGELSVRAGSDARSMIAFASKTSDSLGGTDSDPIQGGIEANRRESCTGSISVGISGGRDSNGSSRGGSAQIGLSCTENNDQDHVERYIGGGERRYVDRKEHHFSVTMSSGITGEMFAGNQFFGTNEAFYSASGSTTFKASADCCHCHYPATYPR